MFIKILFKNSRVRKNLTVISTLSANPYDTDADVQTLGRIPQKRDGRRQGVPHTPLIQSHGNNLISSSSRLDKVKELNRQVVF